MSRWDSVKYVYQAALDKRPTERAAFLDEVCADNVIDVMGRNGGA
jgi:hypothetical protein